MATVYVTVTAPETDGDTWAEILRVTREITTRAKSVDHETVTDDDRRLVARLTVDEGQGDIRDHLYGMRFAYGIDVEWAAVQAAKI